MNKHAAILAIAAVLLLGACSDPKKELLPPDPTTWSEDFKKTVQKLPDEDRRKVAAYLVRAKISQAFGGAVAAAGMTIDGAIKDQTEWEAQRAKQEADAQALKIKLAAEAAEFQKVVAGSVTVSILSMKFLPRDSYSSRYSDYEIIKLGIENRSGKDIAGIKGSLAVYDMFDTQVGKNLNFSYEDGVKASATATWTGQWELNRFEKDDQNLAGVQEGKYKYIFNPSIIVFSDGTRLDNTKNTN